MIDIKNMENCTGCSACMNICPVHAIKMVSNEEGFLFPAIDMEKCIDCGKCEKVCQITNSSKINKKETDSFYAVVNKNSEELMRSSSGGVFSILADYIIAQEGYVAGCIFDENMVAQHILLGPNESYEKMRGSKYVQSNMGDIYLKVKGVLSSGQKVLFTGTPCQVEGLYLFLQQDYDNLITVDLICHGVSSPKLWEKHKNWLEEKYNGKMLNYQFRSKNNTGLLYYYYYLWNERRQKKRKLSGVCNLDPYYMDFLQGKNYRECCYNCKFTNLKRKSDFTIGDYWGVENFHKDFETEKGVSLLLLNTRKAKNIFEKVKDNMKAERSKKEWALIRNHQLSVPVKRLDIRDGYYEKVYKDIDFWERNFRHSRKWVIVKIKCLMPTTLKRKIKNKFKIG